MAVVFVLLVLMLSNSVLSQTNDHDNVLLGMFCGRNAVTNVPNYMKNRNAVFNDLRMQLLSKRVVYARAQDLSDGDSVFAVAQCRNYLSMDRCVACFDASVSGLTNCTNANGYIIYDNCFIRYEDFNEFYNDPYFMTDGTGLQYLSCGNQSASRQTTFNQAVDGVLSNVRDATPKTSNFYVASTRKIISENVTVYVTAQCIENINQDICQTCMNTAYGKLNDCLPNTEGRYSDMACFTRYSDTPFFNDNQTTDITNVLKGHSSKPVAAIIAAAIGGGVLFFLILVFCLLYRKKKLKKIEQGSRDLNGVIYYNYKDLRSATNNFSQENVLGKGGFGEVYKATLDNNITVAVKKLQVLHAVAQQEFENEVKLVSNIQHRNLLCLLGWSSEGSHLFLVLEYMPNGSLDRFLWGAQRGTLNWSQRYEIILGIARGLAHLHDEFHFKIIHRDIKSSNILLSDDFRPKIADFGLARFQPEGQSHVSTGFAGTLGYTAPEYAIQGILSDKVDTYSFGIVVLEIISGRRSTELRSHRSSIGFLLEDAWEMYENTKKYINVIDETMSLNGNEQELVMKIIEVALLCTMSPASDRPVMSEVVSMLQEGKLSGKIQLTRPTFLRNEDRRVRNFV
ncbi:cysteine-rich receptor-like protein kinase 42 [Bidens hawaiensis]|uniref:cysteine-rich receptor-like protein kinase 42 n=1 Tax=Bidens hawaiensis TaxID=980011 RepID=UPI00404B7977